MEDTDGPDHGEADQDYPGHAGFFPQPRCAHQGPFCGDTGCPVHGIIPEDDYGALGYPETGVMEAADLQYSAWLVDGMMDSVVQCSWLPRPIKKNDDDTDNR